MRIAQVFPDSDHRWIGNAQSLPPIPREIELQHVTARISLLDVDAQNLDGDGNAQQFGEVTVFLEIRAAGSTLPLFWAPVDISRAQNNARTDLHVFWAQGVEVASGTTPDGSARWHTARLPDRCTVPENSVVAVCLWGGQPAFSDAWLGAVYGYREKGS